VNGGLAFIVGAVACMGCSALSLRLHWCRALPTGDRWHRRETPLTGGLALLVAFLLAIATIILVDGGDRHLGYLALAATAAFLLGFADDARQIGPGTKFSGQILIACGTA